MKIQTVFLMTVTGCLLASGIFFTGPAAAESITDHWDKLHATLDDTLTMLDEKQGLPENTWNPFKEDRQSLDKKINALLDEAVEILNISDLSGIKEQINQSQEAIRGFREKIAGLQTEKIMAPKNSSAWKIWENDTNDYEDKIAHYNDRISGQEQVIETLKVRLRKRFADQGIVITPEQIDTLVNSVTGDDDIEIISVFDNIKAITARLKDMTAESGENIDTARRYYGMHTLLLKILLNLQQRYVDRVRNEYLPELNKIDENNDWLMDKTRTLLSASDARYTKVYRANLDSQEITRQTVALYRQYLEKNRDRMTRSREQIFKEYQAAENTYMTVSAAHTVIAMMRDADNLYNAVNDLQVPDLLVFENKDMKAEFAKLTGRLGKQGE